MDRMEYFIELFGTLPRAGPGGYERSGVRALQLRRGLVGGGNLSDGLRIGLGKDKGIRQAERIRGSQRCRVARTRSPTGNRRVLEGVPGN